MSITTGGPATGLRTWYLALAALGGAILAASPAAGQVGGSEANDTADTIAARVRQGTLGAYDVLRLRGLVQGMAPEELEGLLGSPQAVLRRYKVVITHYYGPTGQEARQQPLELGPVEITYSQYDTVLGKVLYEESATDVEGWRAKYAHITPGMSREEVEAVLGAPQAHDRLLYEPYATGPSIPHAEVFYGPMPGDGNREPIVLGPVYVLLGRSGGATTDAWSVGRLWHQWRRAGLDVQSWSPEACRDAEVPVDEGWADRYARIKLGMQRSEVETTLGEPTQRFGHETVYGPPARVGPEDSGVLTGKIHIEYDVNERVSSMRYVRDRAGYEHRYSCASDPQPSNERQTSGGP